MAALDGRWRPILLTATFDGPAASSCRDGAGPNVEPPTSANCMCAQRVDKPERGGAAEIIGRRTDLPLAAYLVDTLEGGISWRRNIARGLFSRQGRAGPSIT